MLNYGQGAWMTLYSNLLLISTLKWPYILYSYLFCGFAIMKLCLSMYLSANVLEESTKGMASKEAWKTKVCKCFGYCNICGFDDIKAMIISFIIAF